MLPTVEVLSLENLKIEGKVTHCSGSRTRSTATPGVFVIQTRCRWEEVVGGTDTGSEKVRS